MGTHGHVKRVKTQAHSVHLVCTSLDVQIWS